jgi:uncharacterized protein (TIRG00374 family)
MDKRRLLIYAVVLAVLAILVYFQFRTWRNFDWATFWESGKELAHPPHIYHVLRAIGWIYLAYIMRAIRWQIFLRPVRKTSWTKLIVPTILGFTGLAMLGRPGELIRPYLIARQEKLTFSSQLAVWVVERIFDLAAFTLIMVSAIFLPTKLQAFAAADPHPYNIHLWRFHFTVPLLAAVGYGLLATFLGALSAAVLVNYKSEAIASWVEKRFSHLAKNLGHRIAQRIREFADGLNTIHGPLSFLQLSAVSVLMWWLIAVAYKEVTHSYSVAILDIAQTKVLLLMGSSMVGSMIQLPGVGGGSQLATIAALEHIFDVPHELAASCGILLWLVTFVAVVPLGLVLAHRERLSFRQLSEESQHEEEEEVITHSHHP